MLPSHLPRSFQPSAGKDVINRLLDKRETHRLGSRSGASEVKQHKWFAKTNWGLLRNQQPPVSDFFRFVSLLGSLAPLSTMATYAPLSITGAGIGVTDDDDDQGCLVFPLS
jgi:hypothetical protein